VTGGNGLLAGKASFPRLTLIFSFVMWYYPVLTLAFCCFVRELITLTKTLVMIRSLLLGRWFFVLTVCHILRVLSLSGLHFLQCLSL
jgi:hypothetical protein